MKTFPCPYCGEKFNKILMVKHIEKEHDDELPMGYTAYRATYDLINNKKGHGVCTVCGKDTKWNDKTQKYNRLCGDPNCAKKVREIYRTRMIKVYNKVHLLDDPEQQEKMLANRRISGKYKWRDGTIFTYVGSFEKDLLEFLDQTMEFDSHEIVAPGPKLEYEFEGKKHIWITDFLILPYNLIIEVKDGGDNPNKRNMPVYRGKQYAKEKMITNMGTYSYLRLTNNNFGQLLSIMAELKKQVIDKTESPLYRIHEEVECDMATAKLLFNSIHNESMLVDITCTGYYKDASSGELYLECAEIHTTSKNRSTADDFTRIVEGFTDPKLYKSINVDLILEPINENNILDGYSFGFLVGHSNNEA